MAESKNTAPKTTPAKKEDDRPDQGAYDLRNSPSLILAAHYDELNKNNKE